MSNEMKNNENFYGEAQRDESIDLNSLVKQAKSQNSNETKTLSPLEQKMNNKQELGMMVDNSELKENNEKVSFAMNDQRMDEMNKRVEEMDSSLEKRKHIVVIQNPVTQPEYMEMMMELESVNIDDNGNAKIDYKNSNGELIKPRFIRLRTKDDPSFEEEMRNKENNSSTNNERKNNEEVNNINITKTNTEEAKSNIVKIIIDKTGLGIDSINFTEDEKKKIYESQEIQLNEVEVLDIESIKSSRSEKSFQEAIHEYQLSNSKTTICFPASGFRAQMKGLTYGELGDIALSLEAGVTVDQYYKRLSIIYNKMMNISTGPFNSFEDFLKSFAYTDIPMALYGLYVATQPEVQQIQLKCGNNTCLKNFEWSFNTRSLLSLEHCSTKVLNNMELIASAPAMEYDKIKNESAVMNSKFIRMPRSKFIIEIGVISAYEFLYNVIPTLDEEKFKESFGEDPNQVYANNALLLMSIRSVRIPSSDGTYIVCEGYKEILDAIYNISPEEIKIIAAYANKLATDYTIEFSFKNVKCPYCGSETKNIEVSMDELVFRTYQQLLSTEINVENIQDL